MKLEHLVGLGWVKWSDALFATAVGAGFAYTVRRVLACSSAEELAVVVVCALATLLIANAWLVTLVLRAGYFALRAWGTADGVPDKTAQTALKIVNAMSTTR